MGSQTKARRSNDNEDIGLSGVCCVTSSIQTYVKPLISHSIVQITAHFPSIFFISDDEVILFCTVLRGIASSVYFSVSISPSLHFVQ